MIKLFGLVESLTPLSNKYLDILTCVMCCSFGVEFEPDVFTFSMFCLSGVEFDSKSE